MPAHPSYDITGDGYVSNEEYNIARMFDVNRDGVLQPEERKMMIKSLSGDLELRLYEQRKLGKEYLYAKKLYHRTKDIASKDNFTKKKLDEKRRTQIQEENNRQFDKYLKTEALAHTINEMRFKKDFPDIKDKMTWTKKKEMKKESA